MDLVRELARMALRAVTRRAERMARFSTNAGSDRRYQLTTQHTLTQLRALMPHLKAALNTALSTSDTPAVWSDSYMRAMVYQMLLAMPFSSYMVARKQLTDPVPPAVVERAAMVFDLTVLPNNELRPLATRWVNWAYKRLCSLAGIVATLQVSVATNTVGDAIAECSDDDDDDDDE